MTKRKSVTLEQAMAPRPAPADAPRKRQPERRPTRAASDETATQASHASRQPAAPRAKPMAESAVPQAMPQAIPQAHVPTVAELARHLPSIVSFPGLALSTVAPLPPRVPAESPAAGPVSGPAATTQPGIPSVRQCLAELRLLLSEGWEIVPPIFARPLWSVADDSITAFNFVLRRERATRLVLVPEGRTVQRFIREQDLTVDYRR